MTHVHLYLWTSIYRVDIKHDQIHTTLYIVHVISQNYVGCDQPRDEEML